MTEQLTEMQKEALRAENPNWAYDMCCGEPFNCGGCVVDRMTGA